MTENTKNPTCCICGCECENKYGNNPWPVVKDEGAVCCNACDETVVIPARFKQLMDARAKENRKTEKVSLRISKAENQMLEELCAETGRSKSNLIVSLIRVAHKQLVEDKD